MLRETVHWASCALSIIVLAQCASAARLTGSRGLLQPLPAWCAKLGPQADSTFFNASSTCLKLWSTGAPIQTPDDSDTIKYGQMWSGDMSDANASFIDRNGKLYPVLPSANPPPNDLALQRQWVLVVVQAQLDTSGNVTSFSPVLYVPYSTIMATMANTQFEGTLTNTAPRPVGANETAWFRWTFGSTITMTGGPTDKYGTFLHGAFDNLFQSVLDSHGNCRPALCSDPTFQTDACKYYTQWFGNSTNEMTLNWDVNMHYTDDTELVPMFPATQRQYMAQFIDIWGLLNPTTFVPRRYNFFGHGTPLGVPEDFTGILTAAFTPVVRC